MRYIFMALLGLLVAALACAGLADYQKAIAREIEKLIKADGTVEVLSLDPSSRHGHAANSRDVFHGFGILGAAKAIGSQERAKLLSALARSVIENDGYAAACFEPRHGLRFVSEQKIVDIVICFHCASAHCYGINGDKGILLTASAEPAFDAFLKRNKVALAGKSK